MSKKVCVKSGDRFGKLTVVSDITIKKTGSKNKALYYQCACDCGQVGYYIGSRLLSLVSKQCRNCAAKDRTEVEIKVGDIFGDLSVIVVEDFIKGKHQKVVAKCKCGTVSKYVKSLLITGKSKHCKRCAYKNRPQSLNKCDPFQRLFNLSINQRCMKSKGRIENRLTIDQFKQIVTGDCYYCGSEPKTRGYLGVSANGVDRLDSNRHYQIDNCVACCKICNTMKNTLKTEEFLHHINKILKCQKQKGTTKAN